MPRPRSPIVYYITSVRIPESLLGVLDKRASALGITRNRLINRYIDRGLREDFNIGSVKDAEEKPK